MNRVHGWAFPEIDRFMASEIRPDGSYQGSHLTSALALVTEWSVAIDAGAHVGTFSRPMSAKFRRVLAFEPSSDTCEALRANMVTFGCANVEVHQAALGSAPGWVSMAPLEPRAEALQNTGARFVQAGGDIPVVTIDSFSLDGIGFIKADVEGSELAVFQGAAKTLKRCRPIVLFEQKGFGRRYGQSKDAVESYLTSVGYRHRATVGCDRIWGPR